MSTQDPQDTPEAPRGTTLVHAAREALTKSLWGLCAIVEAAGCDCEEDCEGCTVAEIAEELGSMATYCADETHTLAEAVDRADDADGEANWIANLDVPGAREAVQGYETAASAARALCGEATATKATSASVDLAALLQTVPRGPWYTRVETRMIGAGSERVGVIRALACDEDLAPIVWNPRVAELMAKAPELARDLLAAQAENAALRVLAYIGDHHFPDLTYKARYEEAMRDLRDARAIIDGRTTPPTEAEVEAHEAAGGAWLVVWPCSAGFTAMIRRRDVLSSVDSTSACVALDARRRPCAWPVMP